MKTKDGYKVRIGSWIQNEEDVFEVIWIDSNLLGLRAVRLIFSEEYIDGVAWVGDDIRLFDDDQVAEMEMLQV